MINNDISNLAIYACRYVLGRMSYAPSDYQHTIHSCYEQISLSALEQILKDVKEAINNNRTGDPKIDHPGWVEFSRWLEEIISERSS